MIRLPIFLAATACIAVAGVAIAGGHSGNPAVKARKAHMQLYAHNMGVLGGMAKGEVEYNADIATAAATNLVTLTGLNQMTYWVPGTSSDDLPDESRALPAIWEDGGFAKAMEIGAAMNTAAQALAEAAGNGPEAIGAAMGGVGQQCSVCHKAFQKPRG